MTLAADPISATRRAVDGSTRHSVRRLYIDPGQEAVVHLHRNSELCWSESLESEIRVGKRTGSRAILVFAR